MHRIGNRWMTKMVSGKLSKSKVNAATADRPTAFDRRYGQTVNDLRVDRRCDTTLKQGSGC